MKKKEEWWGDFFTSLWLDTQKESKPETQTHIETDFIQKVLSLMPQAKVLDVPCGDGRHSIELSKRGYQVTGVDITLPFLTEAKRKATEQHLEIAWEHRDMRDLPGGGGKKNSMEFFAFGEVLAILMTKEMPTLLRPFLVCLNQVQSFCWIHTLLKPFFLSCPKSVVGSVSKTH